MNENLNPFSPFQNDLHYDSYSSIEYFIISPKLLIPECDRTTTIG
ncbi:MAG: hypothetical protein AAGE84_20945 [Cyanobacteria bacterium P01_G01_bin.39]